MFKKLSKKFFTKKYLKEYGAYYNIPFEKAQKTHIYKCVKASYFENLKSILGKNDINEVPSDNVPISIEFYDIYIAIHLYDTFDDKIDRGFVIFYADSDNLNDPDINWVFDDYSPLEVKVTDNLEEVMFNELIRYCKERELVSI